MTDDDKKIIAGVLKADVVLPGGKMYPKEVLRKAIEEHQPKVKERSSLVPTLEYGWVKFASIADAAGVVTKLDPDTFEFEIEVLDTPAGQEVLRLMEDDMVMVTPVGEGTLEDNVVQRGYKLNHLLISYKGSEKDGKS